MSENGILEAEQRVREMNRMTRQYSEQGNRYLQSMRNFQTDQNFRQTRFEPAEPYSAGSPRGHYSPQNIPQNSSRDRQHNGQQNQQPNGQVQNQFMAEQSRQHNGNPNRQQAGIPRGHYSPQNTPQNGSQNQFHNGNPNGQPNVPPNRNQNRNQNGNQNGQQTFRNPQNNNCPPNFQPYCPPAGDHAGDRRNVPAQNEIHSNTGNSNTGNHNDPFGFPDLLADNEKLMILLLMYLLMKEKADIKLILALGYLLL